MPDVCKVLNREPDVIGGWMPSLLNILRKNPGLEIGIATAVNNIKEFQMHYIDGVYYYLFPSNNSNFCVTTRFKSECFRAFDMFSPDLIHVHGTENHYGVALKQKKITCPVVVSIQGLLSECWPVTKGKFSIFDYCKVGVSGLSAYIRFSFQSYVWRRKSRHEIFTIRNYKYFIGRTDWDRQVLNKINPDARYFHIDEVLRPVFYQRKQVTKDVKRYQIFSTSPSQPLKGFHHLITAVSLLKDKFPSLQVRAPGAPWDSERGYGFYGRFIYDYIRYLGVEQQIQPLPILDAHEIRAELESSHLFVLPSLIENSPNSLAEAIAVGVPCVASNVGGVHSIIKTSKTGVLFTAGNATKLANAIELMFNDDASLSRSASKDIFEDLKNPIETCNEYITVYEYIANQSL